MTFSNTFKALPDELYSPSSASHFSNPKLIKFNDDLASELGLNLCDKSEEELAHFFVGKTLLPGSEPISQAYAGHQFGHFVDQLGDGRAILLGEVLSPSGKRFDIQLKGAGQTKYSRNGDGRSAMGPVIREYILSEAMYRLGVPTTRALAAVDTGDTVYREVPTPGAVFTRVASSHLRIGSFQFLAARNDHSGLKALLGYAIKRHYPEIQDTENPALLFLKKVAEAQIKLVSQWMSLGFIHGVMNTDNMTISGETIDYGPCAFMDNFNFDQVYSFIDRNGRYSYGNQAKIVIWNLCRLADCLVPLVDADENEAVKMLNYELSLLPKMFELELNMKFASKLGLKYQSGDEEIIQNWLQYMQTEKLDFTLSFRKLSDILVNDNACIFRPTEQFGHFEASWRPRLVNLEFLKQKMDQINPLFIPRNHNVEKAIKDVEIKMFSTFHELCDVLKNPFSEQDKFSEYANPPKEIEKIKNTFCGT